MVKRALLIGINEYGLDSGLSPLKFAEADARSLAEVLRRRGGFETTLLLGRQATRDAMEEAVAQAGRGETFLFFFAGHGQLIKGQYKLHPVDSKASGVRALSFVDLSREWQYGSGYEKVLAILDACRSETRGMRGGRGLEAEASRDIRLATDGERWVEVLYGCSEGECSYEVEELGHGLLTKGLLEALGSQGGEVDSHVLSGAAADWMRSWSGQDPQGRRQEAYRYHRPTLTQRIVVAGAVKGQSEKPAAQVHSKVVCAICGLRNELDQTFRCVKCERDGLCLAHYRKDLRRCEECVGMEEKAMSEAPSQKPVASKPSASPVAEAPTSKPQRVAAPNLRPLKVEAVFPMTAAGAQEVQQAAAEALGLPLQKSADLGKGVKIDLTLIPAGEFMMGSPDSEAERSSDEGPQHRVRISKPFYLGKYEVTQEQWQAVMGSNPSRFAGGKNPVEQVSWNDCQEFLEKLNAMGKGVFRLPTEAEWEYACRAGTTTPFHSGGGGSALGSVGWFDGNSGGKTHPVGKRKPNAWGLHDMHGNVWEWCQTLKRDHPYQAGDGREDLRSGAARVLRGGSWGNKASNCRSAFRNYCLAPGSRYRSYGFRVVAE